MSERKLKEDKVVVLTKNGKSNIIKQLPSNVIVCIDDEKDPPFKNDEIKKIFLEGRHHMR